MVCSSIIGPGEFLGGLVIPNGALVKGGIPVVGRLFSRFAHFADLLGHLKATKGEFSKSLSLFKCQI
jgi:hypothetical protein